MADRELLHNTNILRPVEIK